MLATNALRGNGLHSAADRLSSGQVLLRQVL